MKRILEFFSRHDFTVKEVQKMLYTKPRILELSKANLVKRFNEFLKLSWPSETVKNMIIECPGLLLLNVQEVNLQQSVS